MPSYAWLNSPSVPSRTYKTAETLRASIANSHRSQRHLIFRLALPDQAHRNRRAQSRTHAQRTPDLLAHPT
eukprot:2700192-Pyramimonas_sp.AAC.1